MSNLPFLILMLLAIAVLLRVDFVFYIAYVCIGIYAWSRWVTPRSLSQLWLGRNYRDHAFLGESVPVVLTVQNRSRVPVPWLHLRESIPLGLQTRERFDEVVAIRGRATIERTYDVEARRRGYYRLGPLFLSLGDLFGFNELAAQFRPDYLTVYPRIIPLTRLGLPSRLPFGTLPSWQPLFEDPARPIGVREFRSGDSLRQINWKVSARQLSTQPNGRQLHVKTYEPAISLDTAILLNLNIDDYSHDRYQGPEWAIEVAASLAAHLVDRRQAVGLMTNGADPLQATTGEPRFDEQSGRLIHNDGVDASTEEKQLRKVNGSSPPMNRQQRPGGKRQVDSDLMPPLISPRSGRAHLMKVLEILARIEATRRGEFNSWIPRACLHLSWGVTILTVTPDADIATCEALHRLVRAGFNPVLIAVGPVTPFAQVRERARRLGFTAYQVSEERALDQFRQPVDWK